MIVRAFITLGDGAIVFVRDITRGKTIFLKFPGGFVEPGESFQEALERELEQETRLIGLAIPPKPIYLDNRLAVFKIVAADKSMKDLGHGDDSELEEPAALYPWEIEMDKILPSHRSILGAALAA